MPGKTIFETELLHFRQWTSEDLDYAMRLWGDSEVMKYLDLRGGLPKDLVDKRLNEEMSRQDNYGLQYWMVFENKTGDFIGACGLKPWIHSPREGTELGFCFVKEKWGQGWGKKCAKAVVLYAKEKLGLTRFLAGHHPDNTGSKKILISLGFRFTDNLPYKPTGLMHPCYELDLLFRNDH